VKAARLSFSKDGTVTYGSLFSGIEGFGLGLECAGMECSWQCEINDDCQKVLSKHWPNVPKHKDVRDFNHGRFVRPDLICGGFPCQDISLVGPNTGLAGERSGLWFEFQRVIRDFLPKIVLVENVPGLLTSNKGCDLLTVIQGLAELRYGVAWRVLNSRWFGLPQNRERIFIVGCRFNPRRAAEILFERDALPWDDREVRENRLDVAASDQERPRETVVCFQPRIARNGRGQPKEYADALVASETGPHGDSKPHIVYSGGVRSLMPVEWLRIQGFPDDWLDGFDFKDMTKFRMIGNAVSPPVSEWIGKRIVATSGME
jgi:DNA (cytosine-5)-methyltransferase 1